jgi:hypothetical protein
MTCPPILQSSPPVRGSQNVSHLTLLIGHAQVPDEPEESWDDDAEDPYDQYDDFVPSAGGRGGGGAGKGGKQGNKHKEVYNQKTVRQKERLMSARVEKDRATPAQGRRQGHE